MNQWEYQTIVSILNNGAPALANGLVAKINSLITDNERLKSELEAKNKQAEKNTTSEKQGK